MVLSFKIPIGSGVIIILNAPLSFSNFFFRKKKYWEKVYQEIFDQIWETWNRANRAFDAEHVSRVDRL